MRRWSPVLMFPTYIFGPFGVVLVQKLWPLVFLVMRGQWPLPHTTIFQSHINSHWAIHSFWPTIHQILTNNLSYLLESVKTSTFYLECDKLDKLASGCFLILLCKLWIIIAYSSMRVAWLAIHCSCIVIVSPCPLMAVSLLVIYSVMMISFCSHETSVLWDLGTSKTLSNRNGVQHI